MVEYEPLEPKKTLHLPARPALDPRRRENAGNLTLFNNGRDRPEGPFSSVDEITPPLLPDGRYVLEADMPYGPGELSWIAHIPPCRFALFISGATRLRNEKTLVCAGTGGMLLEVTRDGDIVWEDRNPYSGNPTLSDGSPVGPGISGLPFAVFRATRIPPDHPALRARHLAPLDPQPVWAASAEAGSLPQAGGILRERLTGVCRRARPAQMRGNHRDLQQPPRRSAL